MRKSNDHVICAGPWARGQGLPASLLHSSYGRANIHQDFLFAILPVHQFTPRVIVWKGQLGFGVQCFIAALSSVILTPFPPPQGTIVATCNEGTPGPRASTGMS